MTYNNNINEHVTGLVNASGTGTFSGVTVTQYNSLIGSTSNGITSVAPSATSGVPLISQGSSSNPAYGTMVVSAGGTGITSATAYGIICAGTTSTGAFQVVTPGTSGYLLESGGSSALPSWVSVGGSGNFTLIQSQTVSAVASVSFTSGITATYNTYALLMTSVTSSTASTDTLVQISTNGGSSYISSGYNSGFFTNAYNATNWINSSDAVLTNGLVTLNGPTSSYYNNSLVYLFNMTSGSGYVTQVSRGISGAGISTPAYAASAGAYGTASTTVNALQVSLNTGNISGTFSLFGILE